MIGCFKIVNGCTVINRATAKVERDAPFVFEVTYTEFCSKLVNYHGSVKRIM